MKSIYSNKWKFTLSVLSDLAFVVILIFVFSNFFVEVAPLMVKVSSVVSTSDGTNIDPSIVSDFSVIMSNFYLSGILLILSFVVLQGISLYFVLNIVRKISFKVFIKNYSVISLVSVLVFFILYNIFRPLNLVSYILNRSVYVFGLIMFLVFFYFVICYLVAIPLKASFKKPKVGIFLLLLCLLVYVPFWTLAKTNSYGLAPIVLIIVLILISLLKVWLIETK